MPWNGAGGVERTDGTRTGFEVWQEAAAVPINIVPDAHDVHDQDLADMIERCLNLDGENAMAAPLKMGGNTITGLDDGTAATHAATRAQVTETMRLYGPVAATGGSVLFAAGTIFVPSAFARLTRVTMTLLNVSTDAADDLELQLGDASGFIATGYGGTVMRLAEAGIMIDPYSTSFILDSDAGAATAINGSIVLTLHDAAMHTWVMTGLLTRGGSTCRLLAGRVDLPSALNRLRLFSSGAALFDGGSVSILVE